MLVHQELYSTTVPEHWAHQSDVVKGQYKTSRSLAQAISSPQTPDYRDTAAKDFCTRCKPWHLLFTSLQRLHGSERLVALVDTRQGSYPSVEEQLNVPNLNSPVPCTILRSPAVLRHHNLQLRSLALALAPCLAHLRHTMCQMSWQIYLALCHMLWLSGHRTGTAMPDPRCWSSLTSWATLD